MLITVAVPKPVFANHESFHLRYGWLKKAYDQVTSDPRVFSSEDAPVRLGVGKNMVRSIRFWGIANKMFVSATHAKNTVTEPTVMCNAIFANNGLDPYLEKPDTLWLLHWLLFAPPCRMPVWWIIMNEFAATNIKIDDIVEYVTTRVTNISGWKTPSTKSIKKDIDVFVHTYTTRQGKSSMEDYLDCPFRQLHMIKQSSGTVMRFVSGKKHGMSPLIVAFACLDFIAKSNISSKTVSISQLATKPGSVGNIFKINENDLSDMLVEASNLSDIVKLRNVNGSQHLTFDSAEKLSLRILESIYGKKLRPKKRVTEEMITH